MVNVSVDLLEFDTLVDKWKHLGWKEYIKSRIINSYYDPGETAASNKREELIEKEFIIRMAILVHSLRQLIQGVERSTFVYELGNEFIL